jgi:hypothetical protein
MLKDSKIFSTALYEHNEETKKIKKRIQALKVHQYYQVVLPKLSELDD